jgi:hypothetical protein
MGFCQSRKLIGRFRTILQMVRDTQPRGNIDTLGNPETGNVLKEYFGRCDRSGAHKTPYCQQMRFQNIRANSLGSIRPASILE